MLIYLSKYDKEFHDKISNFSKDYNLKVLEELRTRIKYFFEFKEFSSFFYFEPKIPSEKLLINEKMKIENIEMVKKSLMFTLKILDEKLKNKAESISQEEIKNIFIEEIAKV
ncbi:MAG: hypothetical protein LBU14_06130 [Candidatus Peribacteria bacterium]|nr:hypothetical protein [Candidatus Peribacteria bacterium]